MVDIAKIQRKTHKIAIVIGGVCFVLIVAFGALKQMFKESAANQHAAASQRILGRLHIKYETDKETPYVDVFADRDTLAVWRGIFVENHGQSESDVIRDYSKLVATGKLTSVFPDTLVTIQERAGDSDCRVTILSGGKAKQSGWVDCKWITD